MKRDERKRYFRLTVDCGVHGPESPAFQDWSDDEGDIMCCRCGAEALIAKAIELEQQAIDGGEEDWEWLPGQSPRELMGLSLMGSAVVDIYSKYLQRQAAKESPFFRRFVKAGND